MNKIIIYGAGGLGREIALLIEEINTVKSQWNIVGFADDSTVKGTTVNSYPVIGGIDEINTYGSDAFVVIAVGSPVARKKMQNSISNPRISFPVLVHPSAQLGSRQHNFIGRGSIVTAGCILTTNVRVGEFSLLNLMTTIGHDVTLGDFASIMPGCSLSGSIKAEDQVYIGTGAKILPDISLGERCIIGAGAVVTKNVKAFDKVVGIPARTIS